MSDNPKIQVTVEGEVRTFSVTIEPEDVEDWLALDDIGKMD